MSLAYHGGWCGPGWSNNKYQTSVAGGTFTPIDQFDRTCKLHDNRYHAGFNLKRADYDFYHQNIGRGFKRSAAAVAVGVQGYFRENTANNSLLPQKNRMVPIPKTKTYGKRKPKTTGRSVSKRPRNAAGQFIPTNKKNMSTQTTKSRRSKRTRRKQTRSTRSKPKSYKKYSRSRRGRISAHGVQMTSEYGATETATAAQQVIVLGHASSCLRQIQSVFAGALFKKLLHKAGVCVPSFESVVEICPKWNIVVNFADSTSVEQQIQHETLAGTTGATLDQFVAWFCSSGRPWANNTELTNWTFQCIRLNIEDTGAGIAQAAPTTLWLERAKMHYEVKSSMMFQNRSAGALGSEEDQVDNIPLYGYYYEGKGNGPESSATALQTSGKIAGLFGGTLQGIIDMSAAETTNVGIIEPPQPNFFKGLSKYGKVTFGPGEVRSSVLTTKADSGFNTLFRNVFSQWCLDAGIQNKHIRQKIGNFRLFIVEKILQAGAADTADLRLAWQVNVDAFMSFTEGRACETTMKFTSNA